MTDELTWEQATNSRLAADEQTRAIDPQRRRDEFMAQGFAPIEHYERAIRVLDGPDSRLQREYEGAYAGSDELAWYRSTRQAAITVGAYTPKEASK